MRCLLSGCQVLRVQELPPREPYPPSNLVTLFQRESNDVLSLTCSDDCANTLRLKQDSAPSDLVTLEAETRQVDLSALGGKGKAFRLRIVGLREAA
jgi:hypothetical protein